MSEPPAAPKPAAPEPAAKAPEQQMAALTPSDDSLNPGSRRRIGFSEGSARLNDDARKTIEELAAALKKDDKLRLQLFAYARGGEGSSNNPRRLSLSRALAVRSELIDEGIVGRRIEVRAEGDRYKDGPPDRVDMILTAR
jgi:outer membrane protein OmpA-like peptidoglycan-associated protein